MEFPGGGGLNYCFTPLCIVCSSEKIFPSTAAITFHAMSYTCYSKSIIAWGENRKKWNMHSQRGMLHISWQHNKSCPCAVNAGIYKLSSRGGMETEMMGRALVWNQCCKLCSPTYKHSIHCIRFIDMKGQNMSYVLFMEDQDCACAAMCREIIV